MFKTELFELRNRKALVVGFTRGVHKVSFPLLPQITKHSLLEAIASALLSNDVAWRMH